MLENLISVNNISFLLVFFEGLLSFLSPCVLPLIPLYIGYLSGGARQIGEDGTITYRRKKVFVHTLFFVLGISFAFFILGMSVTALGSFFTENQLIFTRIGGILIIFMGLIQIGLLDFNFLKKERKFHLKSIGRGMNPMIAFLMGFTFSFAWTPCVGPALSSVLILASGARSSLLGNVLVLIYSLGFVIPFLILGIFTTQVLNFLKGHQKILKYTVKIGGILLLLIGIMTFTGWMNGISRYFNSFTPPAKTDEYKPTEDTNQNAASETKPGSQNSTPQDTTGTEDNNSIDNASDAASSTAGQNTDDNNGSRSDTEKETSKKLIPAINFTLKDQYGNEHTLSDYKGKVVFLNFWATWCPPCKKEMPDIEELYKEYGENSGDVIILGVANPVSEEYPNNADVKKDEIIAFLEENDYTFPVVFDETGELLTDYSITAFPTTFLIDAEGNIYGYAAGQLTKDIMINAIEQAKKSK